MAGRTALSAGLETFSNPAPGLIRGLIFGLAAPDQVRGEVSDSFITAACPAQRPVAQQAVKR